MELGLDNFAATLASHAWTCVLLYDPHDERETYEQSVVLEGLAERYARRGGGAEPQQQHYASSLPRQLPTMAFGRLNLRKHSMLRDILTGRSHHNRNDKPTCPAQAYYDQTFSDTNAFVLAPETLLDVSLGGAVYWPAHIVLVGPDFNIYALLELRETLLGSIPLKIVLLERWLHQQVQEEDIDDDDDEQQPREPLFSSRSSMERDIRENHLAELWMDDSFTWDVYHKEQQQKQASTAECDDYGTPIATQQRDSRRLLLETDAKHDDDNNHKQRGFFVYRRAAVKQIKPSAVYLDVLQNMVDEYLGWVVGYEVSWSEERKAREDLCTNFGVSLRRMNQQLQTLVEKMLTPVNVKSTQTTANNNNNNNSTDPRRDIPNLKGYFDELVFGPGRSAHSFRQVLADMTDALGDTPEERRHQRNRFHGTEFPVVQPLRDYLSVLEDIHRDPSRYSIVLAEVTANWNNIMREFHKNLNKYYVTKYLKSSDPNNNNPPNFHFRTMDILDMADPTHVNNNGNTTLLTNYHDFHAKYTATGTPVILSNVRLTPSQVVTLQSIVQDCAASDVTNNVQVSQKVGERQASSDWGGLKTYVLEDSLLNEERHQGATHRQKVSNSNAKKRRKTLSDSSDDEEDDEVDDPAEDGIDRSLTMKQYAILSEQIDTLYLHDFTLEDNCDYFLYNHTPYDEQQKFQIPSVIASYDFFQRLPHSSFASSWPSLFVGKQGSNSKLHVDNGASGFFMYLISGQKRWIVYNRDERVHLYERIDAPSTYPDVLGIGKDQESDDFLSRRFPLLHRAEAAYEIIQEPGQLVYIPPNCPHAVENLEDTVGIAMNLVPREGVADHLHHQVHRAEFGVFDLAMNYLLFEDHADQLVDTKDPIYTTFGEYKSQ